MFVRVCACSQRVNKLVKIHERQPSVPRAACPALDAKLLQARRELLLLPLLVCILVVAAVAIVAAGSAAPVLCPVSGHLAPFDLSRLLIDFHDRRLSPARATKDYSDVDVVHLRKRGKQPRAAAQLEALAVTPAQRDERQRGQRLRQYEEGGVGARCGRRARRESHKIQINFQLVR